MDKHYSMTIPHTLPVHQLLLKLLAAVHVELQQPDNGKAAGVSSSRGMAASGAVLPRRSCHDSDTSSPEEACPGTVGYGWGWGSPA